MTRDEIQAHAESLWHKDGRKNTLVLGTGVGKTKTATNITKTLLGLKLLTKKSSILLLVSDTNLRDNSWKDEFTKWGLEDLWGSVQAECYQTAYKWKDKHFDFVIADEVDFCLSEEYSLFFKNNTYSMLLGLTGYVEEAKKEMLQSIAPISYTYTTNTAQAENILNKVHLVSVNFDLSTVKDVEVKYKDKATGAMKSFMQSENEQYAYLQNQCDVLLGKVRRLEKKVAESISWGPDDVKELTATENRLKYAWRQRTEFLYKSKSSARAARVLSDKILQSKRSKVLVFSVRKLQSSIICKHTYNADTSELGKAKLLANLNAGKVREMGLCKALDRGANLEGINAIVMESYNSSKTSFQQRHGRGCRLDPNDMLYLYVLVPYFKKKVKGVGTSAYGFVSLPTQARKWAVGMVTGFTASINSSMKLEI